MSTGYYRICPKCGRKYGRHFVWCLDCTPRAKPDSKGVFSYNTYRTRRGIVEWDKLVKLHFCCSKEVPIEMRKCDTCKAKFKCYTQNDDE
jgi:hypothetical protein